MATDVPQSDVIAIASLLFALVGLLGTFFFVSLSQWLSSILANSAAWGVIRARDPNRTEISARLDCYYKARESRSWATLLAWLVITLFLAFVMYRLFTLVDLTKEETKSVIYNFVIQPCGVFFIVYLAVSILFLVVGLIKATTVLKQFENDQGT
jgi:hypothetical protein